MKIYNNREAFYQWDLEQKITGTSFRVGDQIHFTTPSMSNALVVVCYDIEGDVVADVPNVLLQGVEPITAYRYRGHRTRHEYIFPIVQRAKPDDYVYTETEVKSFEALEKQIAEGEKFNTVEKIELAEGETMYLWELPECSIATGKFIIRDGDRNRNEKAIDLCNSLVISHAEYGMEGFIHYRGTIFTDTMFKYLDFERDGIDYFEINTDISIPLTRFADIQRIGTNTSLKTSKKDNLVNAINEVHDEIDNKEPKIDVLPIEKGGTGQTSPLRAARYLGLASYNCTSAATASVMKCNIEGFTPHYGCTLYLNVWNGNTVPNAELDVHGYQYPVYTCYGEKLKGTEIGKNHICEFTLIEAANGLPVRWVLMNPKS